MLLLCVVVGVVVVVAAVVAVVATLFGVLVLVRVLVVVVVVVAVVATLFRVLVLVSVDGVAGVTANDGNDDDDPVDNTNGSAAAFEADIHIRLVQYQNIEYITEEEGRCSPATVCIGMTLSRCFGYSRAYTMNA